jgi:3-polyprenyl-4-hydroxybenzoate decarboxylase
MYKRKLMTILIAGGVLAIAPAVATAQTTTATTPPTITSTTGGTSTGTTPAAITGTPAGTGHTTTRLIQDFTTFAGSSTNANSLVNGLRHDAPVTLTSGTAGQTTSSVTFTPPTRPMGAGNTFISLAVARQQLTNLGITQPTPDQLKAALVGGTVTGSSGKPTALPGVLTLRAQGQGWGRIAQTQGVQLGQVISEMKAAHVRVPESLARQHVEHATDSAHHESDHGEHRASVATKTAARSVTTAAGGTGARIRTGDADDNGTRRAAASTVNNSSGRGIVTAAGTSPASIRIASGAAHGGSSAAAATSNAGTVAARGIVTASGTSVTSGIGRADNGNTLSNHR